MQHVCPQDACCGLLAFPVWHALHGRPEVADLIGNRPSTATNCCRVKWEFCGTSPGSLSPCDLFCSIFPSLIVGVFVFANNLPLTVDLQLLLLELNSLYFGKHLIFSHHYFKPHTLAERDGSTLGILGTLNLKSSQLLALPVNIRANEQWLPSEKVTWRTTSQFKALFFKCCLVFLPDVPLKSWWSTKTSYVMHSSLWYHVITHVGMGIWTLP